jgi:alkanesulfonate monooxygenase SsuD/methylene tetrahydromethanopterin reductase-like flavin-dependent oxidoreductase (luciferase family)
LALDIRCDINQFWRLGRIHQVKFGVMFQLSVPRPWTRESERTVINNALEQVKLADELGFDYVWSTEHHFLEEYSHSSAPEMFLTACAMVTKRIRLGHGIVVCVPEYSSPIRIAERTAMLDILSGGRLDVGTGRSATWTELAGMGADFDLTKQSWDEYVRVIPKMWTQERFSYQGRFFSMPERAVLPKPYQKPHPPMWVAVTSPGTEVDAAQRGLGSLGLSFGSMADQERVIQNYRRIIKTCEPVGEFVNEHVATVSFMYCHEDDATALRVGGLLNGGFRPLAAQFVHPPEAIPTKPSHTQGLLSSLRQGEGPPPREGVTIGDPHHIVRELKRWESMGVDTMNLILNVVECVPQEEVLKSLRLFAKEVFPHFQPAPAGAKDPAPVAAAG